MPNPKVLFLVGAVLITVAILLTFVAAYPYALADTKAVIDLKHGVSYNLPPLHSISLGVPPVQTVLAYKTNVTGAQIEVIQTVDGRNITDAPAPIGLNVIYTQLSADSIVYLVNDNPEPLHVTVATSPIYASPSIDMAMFVVVPIIALAGFALEIYGLIAYIRKNV